MCVVWRSVVLRLRLGTEPAGLKLQISAIDRGRRLVLRSEVRLQTHGGVWLRSVVGVLELSCGAAG